MKNIKYIKPVLLANFWAEAANNVIFTLNDVMTSYYDVGSVGVLRKETVTISPTNLSISSVAAPSPLLPSSTHGWQISISAQEVF